MRRVKLAAIQPECIGIPGEYNCLSDNYRNIPGEIFENYIKKRMEVTFELLEKAGQEGCDIVATCEDVTGAGLYNIDISDKNIFSELLSLLYPAMESRLSGLSRKYSMYIIGCSHKRIGNRNYNVASVIDRKGNLYGEYRKNQVRPL